MRLLAIVAAICAWAPPCLTAEPKPKTENVILVMLDGLRWQEVFTGADEELLHKERGGVKDVADIRKRFWRDTPEARRETLMPFLWGTVAKDGQIYGNKLKNSVGQVTNKLNYSYPGYSEVLCGFVDPLIVWNGKITNRNETVLEWLNKKPEFEGKVAAFTSWEVFPYIINDKRSGIPVNGGYMPIKGVPDSPEVRLMNKLMTETALDGEETRYDAFTFRAAMLYLKAKKPRVMFISFDETDAQGHAGRYDRLLNGAQKNDGFLKELWETVQEMPEYKGKTTLIITTDHGRGGAPVEWKNHGARVAGAEFFWAAIMGPDTPVRGEIKDADAITQTQIAATLAAALGLNYSESVTRAGKPIAGAIKVSP
ncbi:MAG: AP protein [Planctomycetaceae bacterium]|nr:AP protein [Planctomycetaceae bacterium]